MSSKNSNRLTKAEQFKKCVKRDPTHFKVFKDKKQFKSWNRHLLSTAVSQDVKEILDSHYTQSNPDDAALFKEKQIYMYSIADTILQTDSGIVFVRQHKHDHDDQKVFVKLINYYLNSRIIDTESNDLLQYVTSTKFGQVKWRGTTIIFISHWEE